MKLFNLPAVIAAAAGITLSAGLADFQLVPPKRGDAPKLWDMEKLSKAPKVLPNNVELGFKLPANIRPILYEGVAYKGYPTRVFALLGMPEKVSGPVPGIVLVHGGGGTAFAAWVEHWTKQGYAVIAMDTVGHYPLRAAELTKKDGPCRAKLKHGGPDTYKQERDLATPENSWTVQAVSAVILAHSLLREQPNVIKDKIGIVGISWGGFLTCIASGVDHRFAAAAPVYGCGFLAQSSWTLKRISDPAWLKLYDPANYLPSVECPILFINRPTDPPYEFSSWTRSSFLPERANRSCRPNFGHSHKAGIRPEADIFMDSVLRGAPGLPMVSGTKCNGDTATAAFKASAPVAKATLAWTADDGPEPTRKWQESPAEIKGNTVSAKIPAEARSFYINVYDHRDGVVSGLPALAR